MELESYFANNVPLAEEVMKILPRSGKENAHQQPDRIREQARSHRGN